MQSIGEAISEIYKSKDLTEEKDEIEAKVDDFDEFRGAKIQNIEFSDIRKQNVKQLSEIDSKYKGKVVSRKELNDDDDTNESDENELLDDEDTESEDDYGDIDLSQFNKDDKLNDNDGREREQDPLLIKKKSSNINEIKKGTCVQNQLKIWENLLEVRIKAQKMLISANSFPDYDAFLELSTDESNNFLEKAESTCDNIYELLDNLLNLQHVLVEK